MKRKISVVTACTNGRDHLIDNQVLGGAQFIAYVDRVSPFSIWEQRSAHGNFISPRRNSRIHKILIHQYVDSEYSLWMDANIRLLVPAERLIDEWLTDHDIAMFRHRIRNCVYEEADICAELRLDDPKLIHEQAQSYRKNNFPRQQGLAEACVILRRHNAIVENFNNAWWSEYSRFSCRDQISLMVAARKSAVSINLITPTRFESPYFHCTPRAPGLEHEVELPSNVLEIC